MMEKPDFSELVDIASEYFVCDRSNFRQNKNGICFFLDAGILGVQIDILDIGCRGYIKIYNGIDYATPNEQGMTFKIVCHLLNCRVKLHKREIDNCLK